MNTKHEPFAQAMTHLVFQTSQYSRLEGDPLVRSMKAASLAEAQTGILRAYAEATEISAAELSELVHTVMTDVRRMDDEVRQVSERLQAILDESYAARAAVQPLQ